ncbi:hypothetical protein [Leptolyngbya sp. NIES-2104]|uniref:hypothetical protein n=1 Tax=Leptolyngbya sp. NIES-2104 TaxID=1552121 RepID=UPI0006EC4D22|nr:hypothetical protein [Leptolyngbya sp. NIES-2104]GAP93606.1 hypothetical protein NIES2104_01130 [Leptolyngbya sp. NIES-2104]
MNVQVLAIESSGTNQWNVKLLVGQQSVVYPFAQEEVAISDRSIIGITSDPAFRKFFKFNQHLIHQITHLLIQSVNAEVIEFPVEVGNFLTFDQASEKLMLTE